MAIKTVEVGGRIVEVRPIRWSDWCHVKEAVATLLGSRLLQEGLAALSNLDGEGDSTGWMQDRMKELSGSIGEILTDAIQSADALINQLIIGCTQDVELHSMTAAEAIELAEAAFEVSDIVGLVEREKNFFAAVIKQATARAAKTPSSGT